MIRAMLILLMLTGFSITLTACNTTKGAAKDVQSGAQSVKEAADRNGAN